MSERNYPPAYLRYLKARLSNFLRPSFWGTGIFLFVVVLVIREYWLNPKIFTENPNKEPIAQQKKVVEETSLSAEEKAMAADIDNMPTLLSDFDEENLSTNITISPEDNIQVDNSKTFGEDPKINTNTAKSNLDLETLNKVSLVSVQNPFLVQADKLLQPVKLNNTQFLGTNQLVASPDSNEISAVSNLSVGLNNQSTNNQNIVLVNPLAAAIQQSSNKNPINSVSNNGSERLTAPINSLPNQNLPSSPRMGYVQPIVVNQPQNSYRNFNGVQTTNIGTPTTEMSPIPNNPYNPYSVQPPSKDVVNSTAPAPLGTSNYTLQQPSQLPQSNLSYPGQLQQYPR